MVDSRAADRSSTVVLRPMARYDWARVRHIYLEGIHGGLATFESDAPQWDDFNGGHLPIGRAVALINEQLAGWVALSPVSARAAYRGVAETSVYVSSDFQGRGVGQALLDYVCRASESAGIWTVQATIFAVNDASQQLHKRAGFQVIGQRERIAQVWHGPFTGQWMDTVLMERRTTLP